MPDLMYPGARWSFHSARHLEGLLGAHVLSIAVTRTDLVNDTTLVQVRYRPDATRPVVASLTGVPA